MKLPGAAEALGAVAPLLFGKKRTVVELSRWGGFDADAIFAVEGLNEREKLVNLLKGEIWRDVDGDERILAGVGELAECGQKVDEVNLAGDGLVAGIEKRETIFLKDF